MAGKTSDEHSEFVFHRGFYLVELVGKKAGSLKEFLKYIKTIDEQSVFQHMYHTLLQHHFVIPEYYNDFAHWLGKELHEDVLAERFAYVGLSEYGDINSVRQKLVEILEERMKQKSSGKVSVPDDRAFHFVKSNVVVMPTKYRAKNIDEFLGCLDKIDGSTLFYHFFSSRLKYSKKKEKYVDDFSRWFNRIGHSEIADKISSVCLYGYTLEGIRKEIRKIIKEAQ
ncbi:MAG: DUF5752 family protein [Candidatus Hydrothermarchaeaceae archaeon]